MHPDLVKLLDLQTKDRAIVDTETRSNALREEEGELDAALRQLQQALDDARRAANAGAARRDEMEARIESYRVLHERRRQRLEFMRNPKEASALMAELEVARSVLAREESEWVRLADAATSLEDRVREAERALDDARQAQAPARASLAERAAVLGAERDRVQVSREESAAAMDKALRSRYERLRGSRAPTVVAPLSGVTCGYCHTAVPLSRRSQIRAGLIIDGCEACGVILYAADAPE